MHLGQVRLIVRALFYTHYINLFVRVHNLQLCRSFFQTTELLTVSSIKTAIEDLYRAAISIN